MQPVRRQTLIAQVTSQLRDEIMSGRWAVGSRIPTEPELCRITGTARNTVREAVQALVHAGMVERRQGSGTYVLSALDGAGALSDYFAAARDSDLLELREALEVTAAGLAAERRDDEDIATLRSLLARRNELWAPATVIGEVEAVVAADVALHRAVVATSHNELYLEFYDTLIPLMELHIGEFPVGRATSYEDRHGAVVAAIIAGDPGAARAAVRALSAELRVRSR